MIDVRQVMVSGHRAIEEIYVIMVLFIKFMYLVFDLMYLFYTLLVVISDHLYMFGHPFYISIC